MSAAPKPMVMLQSVKLGAFALTEVSRLVRKELDQPTHPPLEKEYRQLLHVFAALERTDREVELRVVPAEEDLEP